ncbi:MAG: hypothetical protein AAF488_08700 [Planctomycetota bacterium]
MSFAAGTIFQMGSAPVIEETLRFTETRHRLILSNVANSDTPNYRRQDLDEGTFRRNLANAIEERSNHHPHHFSSSESSFEPVSTWGGTFMGPRVPRMPHEGPTRHDENNISMEREMAILAQNAGKFTTMSNLLRKEWGQLRSAIAERPGS